MRDSGDATEYHELMHPNLLEAREKSKQGLGAWFERMDRTYIRPFLVYKYETIKDRMELEFEDVLQEYKIIQEELNEPDRSSSQFPHLQRLSREVKDHFEQSRQGERVGLLQQYVEAKMAK